MILRLLWLAAFLSGCASAFVLFREGALSIQASHGSAVMLLLAAGAVVMFVTFAALLDSRS